ncbi:O-acyltransferase like protein-like [Ptychodera flava]|uniref:O-acyltransferase like protein-like n=1 Tax=Ptychodera flava TaxID=63121 RepID=UPI00396A808B
MAKLVIFMGCAVVAAMMLPSVTGSTNMMEMFFPEFQKSFAPGIPHPYHNVTEKCYADTIKYMTDFHAFRPYAREMFYSCGEIREDYDLTWNRKDPGNFGMCRQVKPGNETTFETVYCYTTIYISEKSFAPGVPHPYHNVTEKCYADTIKYMTDFHAFRPYAREMFYSCGEIREDYDLTWNRKDPGNFGMCRQVKPGNETTFETVYCYTTIYISESRDTLRKGVCFPNSCTENDIEIFITEAHLTNPNIPRWESTTASCAKASHEFRWADILAATVCSILAAVLTLGTTYDVVQRRRSELKKTAEPELTTFAKTPSSDIVEESVDALSRSGNVVNVSSRERLDVDEGTTDKLTKTRKFKAVGFLSECLLAFSVIDAGKNILSTSQGSRNIGCLNGIRVLSMSWVILYHHWLLVGSWPFTIGKQLFLISPIFIVVFYKSWIGGTVLSVVTTLISLASTAYIEYIRGTSIRGDPVPYRESELEPGYWLYTKPYHRIPQYLIGIALGYILFKLKGKQIKINKIVNCLIWCCAAAIALAVVYGPYSSDDSYRVPQWAAVMYLTLFRFAMSLCTGWVIFACATGNGGPVSSLLSWSGWLPLSKINYCAYLVHMIVLYLYTTGFETLWHYTDFHFGLEFLGVLALTYSVAFLLASAVEVPFLNFEKIVIPSRR